MMSRPWIWWIAAAAAAPGVVAEPREIGVGVWVLGLGDEGIERGRFFADFNIFLIDEATDNFLHDDVNLVNARNPVVERKIADGRKFLTVKSDFYFQADLREWPFDYPVLDIVLEPPTGSNTTVVYVARPDWSGLSESIRLPGYLFSAGDWDMEEDTAAYPGGREFSQVRFNMRMERGRSSTFIKAMLPPIFMLTVALMTHLLPVRESTTRLSLSGSMLVGATVFHSSLTSGLPNTPYLTIADRHLIIVFAGLIIVLLGNLAVLRAIRQDRLRAAIRVSDRFEVVAYVVPLLFGFLVYNVGQAVVLLFTALVYTYALRSAFPEHADLVSWTVVVIGGMGLPEIFVDNYTVPFFVAPLLLSALAMVFLAHWWAKRRHGQMASHEEWLIANAETYAMHSPSDE